MTAKRPAKWPRSEGIRNWRKSWETRGRRSTAVPKDWYVKRRVGECHEYKSRGIEAPERVEQKNEPVSDPANPARPRTAPPPPTPPPGPPPPPPRLATT